MDIVRTGSESKFAKFLCNGPASFNMDIVRTGSERSATGAHPLQP